MWAQDKRKKTSTKTSSADEGMERREANTLTNLTKVHTMLVFNKESPHIRILSDKSMAVINPLMNKPRGVIEPSFL